MRLDEMSALILNLNWFLLIILCLIRFGFDIIVWSSFQFQLFQGTRHQAERTKSKSIRKSDFCSHRALRPCPDSITIIKRMGVPKFEF
jgi:hypothetical protein